MGSLMVDILPEESPVAKLGDTKIVDVKTEEVNVETKSVDSGYVEGSKFEYTIIEEPSRSKRKLRIICVGAGASAINFAHEVEQSELDLDLVCYEKNPQIGGTWYENKYPGCGCDIPSVNYQLTWAPSADWSSL